MTDKKKKDNKPKVSVEFSKVIKGYLEIKASQNSAFQARYEAEDKSLDDCIQYILNKVQKSGINGFADQEIYNMAEKYYIDDKPDIGKKVTAQRVVVNHKVLKDPVAKKDEKKPNQISIFGDANKGTEKASPKTTRTVLDSQKHLEKIAVFATAQEAMTAQQFGKVVTELNKIREKHGDDPEFKRLDKELKEATGIDL